MDFIRSLQGLIIDLDGVLWRGDQPLGPLSEWFQRLEALGLRWVFATNNATRTIDMYLEKFARMGLTDVRPDQIVNSILAAVYALRQRWPQGAAVYIIGEEGLFQGLAQAGYPFTEDLEAIQAVVVGLDRRLTYDKLALGTLAIRRGAWFIGTNPDRSFPTPEGLKPGAGAILAALEAATDVAPTIVGKPEPFLFQLALERLGTPPEATLVVGDRLETDILGGQRVGCPTALVLSGVTSREQVRTRNPAPDLIVEDFGALIRLLERARGEGGRHILPSGPRDPKVM